MSDVDPLAAFLADLRRTAEAASPGPYWHPEDGDLCTLESPNEQQGKSLAADLPRAFTDSWVTFAYVSPRDPYGTKMAPGEHSAAWARAIAQADHFAAFDRETSLALLDVVEKAAAWEQSTKGAPPGLLDALVRLREHAEADAQ